MSCVTCSVKAGKQQQRVLGVLHSPVPGEALPSDADDAAVETALHEAVDNLSVLVFTHTALAIRFLYHHGVPLSPTEEDGLDVDGPTQVWRVGRAYAVAASGRVAAPTRRGAALTAMLAVCGSVGALGHASHAERARRVGPRCGVQRHHG